MYKLTQECGVSSSACLFNTNNYRLTQLELSNGKIGFRIRALGPSSVHKVGVGALSVLFTLHTSVSIYITNSFLQC